MSDLEPPERFLCNEHSSRVTQPTNCRACDIEKRLTLLMRRVDDLETETSQLRDALADAMGDSDAG